MENQEDILLQITQLAAEIRSIDPSHDPSTLLQQIGKDSDETVWTGLLGYLLDPDADHGLGIGFLGQYLQILYDAGVGPVDPDTTPVSEAEVVIEPYAGGRRADVLIYRPDDWFVLIEGKIGDEIRRNQLTDYAKADRIGSAVDVAEISESRRCYVFLTLPSRESETIPPAFYHQTWDSILTCINDVRKDPTLSQLTQSKLDEFAITIEQTMTNHDIDRQTQLEYTKLFNEYRDAIEKAHKGPRKLAEEVRAEWPEIIRSDRCNPETWSDTPKNDNWHAKDSSGDNSHVFRTNWKVEPRILGLHLEVEPTPASNMREVFESPNSGSIYIRMKIKKHAPYSRKNSMKFSRKIIAMTIPSILNRIAKTGKPSPRHNLNLNPENKGETTIHVSQRPLPCTKSLQRNWTILSQKFGRSTIPTIEWPPPVPFTLDC